MLLRYDRFEVDTSAGVFRVDGRVLSVQPKVYWLLRLLMERQGDVITKNELFSALWPNEFVTDSALTWCVSQARKAFGQPRTARTPIETVHRRGYRFAPRVAAVAHQDTQTSSVVGTQQHDPFVGRREVMRSLEAAWLAAAGGGGRLCLLTGEAGIGKTRIAHELALRARQLGCDVWQGRGFPGDGASALWPWLQVLRDALTQDELASEARSLSALLAQGDESGTFLMLDRVAQFLLQAEIAPRLLLLEDLHDFDDASLRLLLLLAQNLRGARVMVLATLRVPADLSERQKRDFDALARLSERIELDGLDATSINDYAQAALGQALSEQACQLLLHKTGGIPLFVRAALDGLAHKPAHGLGANEFRIPDSTKDILLENLRELSAHTRELIDVASVLGDELDVADLQPMCQLSADDFLRALDQAVAARVLRPLEEHGHFRFRHHLLCEVSYEGLTARRRAELHLRVARLLDSGSALDHQSELAYHYHRALPLDCAADALQQAQRAAEAAARVGAYEQAARCQGWALDAFGLLPERDPRILAELLARLAELQRASGQDLASQKTASTLIALAKQHGFPDALLRAVRTLRWSSALAWMQNATALDALERARELSDERDPAQQSQLLAYLSQIPPYSHDMPESKRLSSQALALARQTDQPSVLHDALRSRLYALSGPADLVAQLAVSDELLRMVEPQNPTGIIFQEVQLTRFLAFLQLGEMSRADAALAHMRRAALLSKVPEAIWHTDRLLATRQLARGEVDAAEQAFQLLEETRERLAFAYEAAFLGPQVVAVLRERGELKFFVPNAGRSFFERESHAEFGVPRVFDIARVAGLAHTQQVERARSLFEDLATRELERVPENTPRWVRVTDSIAARHYITHRIAGVKSKLDMDGQRKLDAHLEHVRALEITLANRGTGTCALPAPPKSRDEILGEPFDPVDYNKGGVTTAEQIDFENHVRDQVNTLGLAFKCGLTKVATLQLASSDCRLVGRGQEVATHYAAHFGNHDQRMGSTYHWASELRDVLDTMAAYDMGNGLSMLDTTQVVLASEMGVPEHGGLPPFMTIGGQSGFFKKGQHVKLMGTPSPNRLHLTMLKAFGIDLPSFGDTMGNVTGVLEEIIA